MDELTHDMRGQREMAFYFAKGRTTTSLLRVFSREQTQHFICAACETVIMDINVIFLVTYGTNLIFWRENWSSGVAFSSVTTELENKRIKFEFNKNTMIEFRKSFKFDSSCD